MRMMSPGELVIQPWRSVTNLFNASNFSRIVRCSGVIGRQNRWAFPSLRAQHCSRREGHDAADIVLQLDALVRLQLNVA